MFISNSVSGLTGLSFLGGPGGSVNLREVSMSGGGSVGRAHWQW